MNIRQKVWTNLLRSRRTIFIGVACLFSALLLAQLVITIARRPGPQPEPNFTLLPNGSSPSLLVGAARPEEIEESQPQQPSMKISEDAQNCTYPAEYWREYPQAWTVEHITVGRSSF